MTTREEYAAAAVACARAMKDSSREAEVNPKGSAMRTLYAADSQRYLLAARVLRALANGAVMCDLRAKVCEKHGDRWSDESGPDPSAYLCARAIRELGDE